MPEEKKATINTKNENTSEYKYSYKNTSFSTQFKDFYLPILSLFIFFAILFLFSIPKIQDTLKLFEEKKNYEVELEDKKVELKDMERLREDNQKNSELLEKLDRIIPAESTDVLAFQDKVAEMAFDNLIDIENQRIGERFLQEDQSGNSQEIDSNEVKTLSLIRITTEFELVGEIDNFKSMLSDIYGGSDFIVISQMELSNPKSEAATMEIVLSKYQYQNPFRDDPTGEQERAFLETISYKQELDQEVVDFIERKSNIAREIDNNSIEDEKEETYTDSANL